MITFEEASKKIAEKYRNSIITDNVIYSKMEKADVLKIISNHLFNHVVKMPYTNLNSGTNSGNSNGTNNMKTGKNGNCYTQVKGIPQGKDIVLIILFLLSLIL